LQARAVQYFAQTSQALAGVIGQRRGDKNIRKCRCVLAEAPPSMRAEFDEECSRPTTNE
jgi:hypothetical protein